MIGFLCHALLVPRPLYKDLKWSIDFLRPVHRKNDRKDSDNYWVIAMGSCFGKLYSNVL